MMSLSEACYGVWLGPRHVGTLVQQNDHTRFTLDEGYIADPRRPVLGLAFEQNLHARHAAQMRLPAWFSNLLPEGRLREWVADARGVPIDREMELLAQVGHDLPGAVRVIAEERGASESYEDSWLDEKVQPPAQGSREGPGWRFSLAGVALKFSMVQEDDRLTLPAFGEGGDWIVKLPDRVYANVPLNEYAMMSLARDAGINVPSVRLVHRDSIHNLPLNVWPDREDWAYAVRRFDRAESRELIHIEDLAQVRNFYPDQKYAGNFETVAALIYRDTDLRALREFSRRLTFNVLISNGDSHLKNWSLIYVDPKAPTLSPAYDLVSTAVYRVGGGPEDLGLKFGGSRLFDRVNVRTFERLQERLGAPDAALPEHVVDTVRRVNDSWERTADTLKGDAVLRESIGASIRARSRTLLSGGRHL